LSSATGRPRSEQSGKAPVQKLNSQIHRSCGTWRQLVTEAQVLGWQCQQVRAWRASIDRLRQIQQVFGPERVSSGRRARERGRQAAQPRSEGALNAGIHHEDHVSLAQGDCPLGHRLLPE
jgi:hypothetical protein